MKFAHFGPVTILHINARKEGDEEKVLAVDLKLSALLDAKAALEPFEPELLDALFTDIGAVRNTMLAPLRFEYELVNYRIGSDLGSWSAVKLRKFSLDPKDVHKMLVEFTATFQPSADEVARVAEYLGEELVLRIESIDGELELQEPKQ